MSLRVVVIEDVPAMRTGLVDALGVAGDLSVVAAAPASAGLWPLLRRTRPGVVLLRCGRDRRGGLRICRRAKADVPAPRVLAAVPSTHAADVIPALVAGADGIVHEAAGADELRAAVRRVASGARPVPRLRPNAMGRLAQRVDTRDLPIVGMAMSGVRAPEIAAVVGLESRQLGRRIDAILTRLCEDGL